MWNKLINSCILIMTSYLCYDLKLLSILQNLEILSHDIAIGLSVFLILGGSDVSVNAFLVMVASNNGNYTTCVSEKSPADFVVTKK